MRARSSAVADWDGPGTRFRRQPLTWRNLLWLLIYPARTQRTAATLPGLVLLALSIGIGLAAYNAANNILFITLALMLACLILSGVLSWLNFRGVCWRWEVTPPVRANTVQTATLVVRNTKRLLASYGLWFDVRTTRSAAGPERLNLRQRLDPRGEVRLDWVFRPQKRGLERLELLQVGSLFPFGFLRKSLVTKTRFDVVVWPASIEYRRAPVAIWHRAQSLETTSRLGHSAELIGLRKYAAGDSHRQIHWKASARLRQLMVRQSSAEAQEGFSLWFQSDADRWSRPEQFETACSLVATLAEDLFTTGKLESVAIDSEPFVPVRQARDLEVFLDRLSLVERRSAAGGTTAVMRRKTMTFAPDGARGVTAYVDGEQAASA